MTQENDLTRLMKSLNVTGAQLAKAMGISRQAFWMKAKGQCPFRDREREILADVLGRQMVYKAIPALDRKPYNTSSCLRIIRQGFLHKTLEEVASRMGVSADVQMGYENHRNPPLSYLIKFATTYHIPCRILMNVDESSWTEVKDENLVLREYEQDPAFLDYAVEGKQAGISEKRRLLADKCRKAVWNLDEYGIEALEESLKQIEDTHAIDPQLKSYKELMGRLSENRKFTPKGAARAAEDTETSDLGGC